MAGNHMTASMNLLRSSHDSVAAGHRMVFEIHGAGGDVWWGDGNNEDEVEGRVDEGKEGVGGTTWEMGGDLAER